MKGQRPAGLPIKSDRDPLQRRVFGARYLGNRCLTSHKSLAAQAICRLSIGANIEVSNRIKAESKRKSNLYRLLDGDRIKPGAVVMDDVIDTLSRCGVEPDIIHIADIGAMACDQSDEWKRLADQGRVRVLGFEPQEEECDRCNATAGAGHRYLPTALGDGTTRTFHRCRFAPTSSFYKPNMDVIARFNGLAAQMEVVETLPIPTKRLDDIEQARGTDFLKLDVQGSELDVLAHATKTLEHVAMIQIETCFLPFYKDQPLFADIDSFLRMRGFELHTFIGFGTRMLLPLSRADIPNAQTKQTLWSDAVYLKSQNHTRTALEPMALLKRAILLHELYQSYDFSARDLKDYDRITGQHSFRAYASMLRLQEAA